MTQVEGGKRSAVVSRPLRFAVVSTCTALTSFKFESRGTCAHSVIMSWKGDSQATAPIGRKASTSVMPVLESIPSQNQEILALTRNGVPPEFSFEVRRQVSLVLKTRTKVVFLFSQYSFSLLSLGVATAPGEC